MSAIRAADININLDLMLATGALVRTSQTCSCLLAKGAVDYPECDAKLRGLWLISSSCKLETALSASPYAGSLTADSDGIAPRAAMGGL